MSSGTTGRSFTTESPPLPWILRARATTPAWLSVRSGVSKKYTWRICASSASSCKFLIAARCSDVGTVNFNSTVSAPFISFRSRPSSSPDSSAAMLSVVLISRSFPGSSQGGPLQWCDAPIERDIHDRRQPPEPTPGFPTRVFGRRAHRGGHPVSPRSWFSARHTRQHRCRPRGAVPRVRAPRTDVRATPRRVFRPRHRHRPHASSSRTRLVTIGATAARGPRRAPADLAPGHRRRGEASRPRSRSRSPSRSCSSGTTGATASRTPFRSCGGSTPCTTASSAWTGSPRLACTRSTPRSPRRSRSCRCSCSATTARRLRRRRGVRHRSRHLPARQRAVPFPRCALGHEHARVAPLAPRDRPRARDKNFGLPLVDKIFGTAYLPKDRRPTGFGIHDPGPAGRLPRQPRVPVHRRRAAAGAPGATGRGPRVAARTRAARAR